MHSFTFNGAELEGTKIEEALQSFFSFSSFFFFFSVLVFWMEVASRDEEIRKQTGGFLAVTGAKNKSRNSGEEARRKK